jgi:hypothetical protein
MINELPWTRRRRLKMDDRRAASAKACGVPTDEQKKAAITAIEQVATLDTMKMNSMFGGRGLSDRTIKALWARGIDAPERLLFMEEPALKKSLAWRKYPSPKSGRIKHGLNRRRHEEGYGNE